VPRQRKTAGVPTKVILDPEIRSRLDTVIATSRQTLSGFVQDAIVQRLARWEPASAFIDRKRKKLGHKEQSAFDAKTCHASGWPKKVPATFWRFGEPADQIANLKQMLGESQPRARELMDKAWRAANLGTYSDRDWDATLAWYREQESQAPGASAPETLPEGWGQ
jgi:hypothetical protein